MDSFFYTIKYTKIVIAYINIRILEEYTVEVVFQTEGLCYYSCYYKI